MKKSSKNAVVSKKHFIFLCAIIFVMAMTMTSYGSSIMPNLMQGMQSGAQQALNNPVANMTGGQPNAGTGTADLSQMTPLAQSIAQSYPLEQWRAMANSPIRGIFQSIYNQVERSKEPFMRMLSQIPFANSFYSLRDEAIKYDYIFGPGEYERNFGPVPDQTPSNTRALF
jgi:hypothetical protein